jgi:hypothetical protein
MYHEIKIEDLDQWAYKVTNLLFCEFFIEQDLTDKQTYLVLQADTDNGVRIVKFPIGAGIIEEDK